VIPTAEENADLGASEQSGAATARLASGARLLGRYDGGGLQQERYLVRRHDGQVVLLAPLLYFIAANADGLLTYEQLAAVVGDACGRQLQSSDVAYLVEHKLLPLGVVETGTHAADRPPRADPLLALSLRGVLLPAGVVRSAARLLSPLFRLPSVLTVLIAVVVLDGWLFFVHGVTSALTAVIRHPVMLLAAIGLLLISTVFHELGHASACSYSGARPGRIGVGMYLMFPAFYTDVTDGYRLDRRGRLYTDVGGIYFNALFAVIATGLYVATGWPVLVVAVLLNFLEVFQQLLPIVRLDGYYILSDLVGVPDLFGRVRPILTSILPGRRADPMVTELRRSARVVVTGWVFVAVPVLAASATLLLLRAPRMVNGTRRSLVSAWSTAGGAWTRGDLGTSLFAWFEILILILPIVGLTALTVRIAAKAARGVSSRRRQATSDMPSDRTESDGPRRLESHSEDNGPGRPIEASTATDGPEEDPMDNATNGSADGASAQEVQPGAGISTDEAGSAAAEGRRTVPAGGPPSAVPRSRPPGGPAPVADPTAASFTEEAMLRARSRPPEGGWRRNLYRATGGVVNVGPSRAELRRRQLAARAKASIPGSRRIVFLSRKGGAGKTTTALMLGHTFATYRGDRVVALDANPDAGSLGHRVRRETTQTVTTMLADRGGLERYADIRAYTSQASTRLEVIASDGDPRISQALGEQDYHQAITLLDRHYNLILLDMGTGILGGAIQGVLKEADQLVVVMPPALDGARVAASTLDWLDRHGYSPLVRGAVAVVNGERGRGFVELDRVEEHFSRRCAAVVRIPWDPMLAAGAATALDELRPATQLQYLELAAAVADGFRTATPRTATPRT
jgi:putative peptide zinc metalloprotease protein